MHSYQASCSAHCLLVFIEIVCSINSSTPLTIHCTIREGQIQWQICGWSSVAFSLVQYSAPILALCTEIWGRAGMLHWSHGTGAYADTRLTLSSIFWKKTFEFQFFKNIFKYCHNLAEFVIKLNATVPKFNMIHAFLACRYSLLKKNIELLKNLFLNSNFSPKQEKNFLKVNGTSEKWNFEVFNVQVNLRKKR